MGKIFSKTRHISGDESTSEVQHERPYTVLEVPSWDESPENTVSEVKMRHTKHARQRPRTVAYTRSADKSPQKKRRSSVGVSFTLERQNPVTKTSSLTNINLDAMKRISQTAGKAMPLFTYNTRAGKFQYHDPGIECVVREKNKNQTRFMVVATCGLEEHQRDTIMFNLAKHLSKAHVQGEDIGFSPNTSSRNDPGIYLWSKVFKTTMDDSSLLEIIFIEYMEFDTPLLDVGIKRNLMEVYFSLGNILVYAVYRRLDESVLRSIDTYMPFDWKNQKHRTRIQRKTLVFFIKSWMDPSKHMYGEDGGRMYVEDFLFQQMENPGSVRPTLLRLLGLPHCFLLPDEAICGANDFNRCLSDFITFLLKRCSSSIVDSDELIKAKDDCMANMFSTPDPGIIY